MTRNERLELCELSKRVFGKRFLWNKFLQQGVRRRKDDLGPGGTQWRYFFTADELKEYMLRIEANAKELLEKMKVDTNTHVDSK